MINKFMWRRRPGVLLDMIYQQNPRWPRSGFCLQILSSKTRRRLRQINLLIRVRSVGDKFINPCLGLSLSEGSQKPLANSKALRELSEASGQVEDLGRPRIRAGRVKFEWSELAAWLCTALRKATVSVPTVAVHLFGAKTRAGTRHPLSRYPAWIREKNKELTA